MQSNNYILRKVLGIEKAKESVRKLAQYPISRILCYHGGTIEGSVFDIKQEILNAAKINK